MYEDIPKGRPEPVDALDADLIEFGWRVMPSRRYKDALKYRYIRQWTPKMIASKFREPEPDHFMLMAVASLSISVEKL